MELSDERLVQIVGGVADAAWQTITTACGSLPRVQEAVEGVIAQLRRLESEAVDVAEAERVLAVGDDAEVADALCEMVSEERF